MTVKHHLNGGYKERQAAAAVAASEDDGASAVYKSAKYGNRRAAGLHNADAMNRMQKGRQQSSSDDDGDSDDGGSNYGGPAAGHLQGYAGTAAPGIAGPVSVAESASVFHAGNVIDGASEAPSSMSSAAGERGHEEDLSVDTRCGGKGFCKESFDECMLLCCTSACCTVVGLFLCMHLCHVIKVHG